MSTIENIEEEKPGEQDFPPQYYEIKEGKRDLDETKAPEWIDAKIKTKEINIAKEGDPKIAKIGDYCSEQQISEIVDLLKEYQDVFARDKVINPPRRKILPIKFLLLWGLT